MPPKKYYPRKKFRRPRNYWQKKKPSRDNVCFYCGKEFTHLPHRCKFCGELFCPDHLLPENHECGGLPPPGWPPPTTPPKPPIWIPPSPPKPPATRPPSPVSKTDGEKINRWQNLGGILFLIGIIIVWITYVLPLVNPTIVLDYYQIWQAGAVFISGGIFVVISGWVLKKRHFGLKYRFYLDRKTKRHLKLISTLSIFTIVILSITNVIVPYVETEIALPLPPPPEAPSLPLNTGITPLPTPLTPPDKLIPQEYYAKAIEIYGNSIPHNIQTLYDILMSDSCKLPDYEFNVFDCSEASARLEWVLEGYGFRTRLYVSEFPAHIWIMTKLDDGSWVAIESTLLTSNNYFPPGIIEGPNGEYREYSFLYQMYREYLNKYDPDHYILPNSYEDFLQNYLQKLPYDPLATLDYYSGEEFYDFLEDAVKGSELYYYPITEFDWWNVNPYNNMKPFNAWD